MLVRGFKFAAAGCVLAVGVLLLAGYMASADRGDDLDFAAGIADFHLGPRDFFPEPGGGAKILVTMAAAGLTLQDFVSY